MSEELKPCPFCEQDAELKVTYTAGGMGRTGAYVRCNNCGAESAFDLGDSGAIESWNNRPIEDALRDELFKTTVAMNGYAQHGISLTAELETMRGLCQTLEANLSGQNDTVEEMHGEVMRLRKATNHTVDELIDIAADAFTGQWAEEKCIKLISVLRAALEPKS